MEVVTTTRDLHRLLSSGEGSLGFVPTMGNLHAGHLKLIQAARAECDRVVASIFVNPMQFNNPDDLAAYPRTVEDDCQALEAEGTDLVFVPEVNVIYPLGQAAQTRVEVPDIGDRLEGEHRPGHFTGVATVVNKLFNLVQPDIAYFGKKDYQQLKLIGKMVDDLAMPLQLRGLDTVREADGLAMSSRNGRLSEDQRKLAPALYTALKTVKSALEAGSRDYPAIESNATEQLASLGFDVDYFCIYEAVELLPPSVGSRQLVALVAANLGTTRLIDNLEIDL
ncbi:MAG: pantoate--beta-alanine ligase [bacterium]